MPLFHRTPHLHGRTPDVALVLDVIRDTGMSARPREGEQVSDVVFAVAIVRGRNPVELQAELDRYVEAAGAWRFQPEGEQC